MERNKYYSEFANDHSMPKIISYEQLEEKMEQQAREEEADNKILAEDM